MTVEWRAEALADVERIVAYIAGQNPFAARRMARALLLAGDSLTVFPRRGRQGRVAGTRELLSISRYSSVYQVENDDAVTSLRIWHAAQDWA